MAASLNPNDPNVAQLEVVASHLGEALRQQLVFVGGAVAGLLITDAAQPAIRPTEDAIWWLTFWPALTITNWSRHCVRTASHRTCGKAPRSADGRSNASRST
jgi:hypothetical protein